MSTTATRTVWQLARLADCHDPDTAESPGAQFLRHVESDVAERVEWMRSHDELDGADLSDVAHEVADGAVPTYTHTKWQTFVDLCAWREDLDDIGGATGDMDQDSNAGLYMIGRRLAEALLDELTEADDDDDDDDDDETGEDEDR